MASNKIDFGWGDIVIIRQTAPSYYKPGSRGCVCGVRVIESKEIATKFNQVIGSELILVEFDNGDTLEIPTEFLSSESKL